MSEEIETGVSHIAYFRTDSGSSKLYTQEYVDDLQNQLQQKDKEIERLKDTILTLENERDILKSKLSDIKADIHYLLENGESIYIRNKYIRK